MGVFTKLCQLTRTLYKGKGELTQFCEHSPGIGCFFASQKMEKNDILLSESEIEINEIPSLKEYQKTLGNLFELDPKNFPKYGYAFLKEALKK